MSSDELCTLPWVALQRATDAIKTCCSQDDDYETDPSISLQDIFNGAAARAVRKSFMEGEVPKGCLNCVKASQSSSTHKTFMSPKWERLFNEELRSKTSSDGFLDSKIRYLDLRLSNVCNFACRTCDRSSSSRWEEIDRKLGHKFGPLQRWDQSPEAMRHVFEALPHVEHLYFAGGEPLINPGHYQVLDWLTRHDRFDIEITYSTNLSKIRYQNFDVMDYWPKFREVFAIPSIDSMGSRGEYIRHGFGWSRFEENLKKVRKHVPALHAVVSVYNVLSVLDLIRWAKHEHGLRTHLFNCYFPDYQSITVLPPDVKKAVTARYSEFIESFKPNLDSDELSRLFGVVKYMNSAENSHLLPKFKKFNDQLDDLHGSRFETVFPESEIWYREI